MATLARITIHPVKSLDGLAVPEARVLPSGALANDRRWQLTDEQGRVVNGKRTALLHAIRADFELAADTDAAAAGWVTLLPDPAALRADALPGLERLRRLAPATFPLVPGPEGPCDWLGEALGTPVRLLERADGGFPDDREAPGPTVAAAATLVEVARWFDLELDECRRRFRVNLEIAGWEAFAEDALASPAWPAAAPTLAELAPDLVADPYADLPPPEPRRFAVGAVPLVAANVCRRCAVPARDSRSGAADPVFRDAFEARRRRGLRRDVDVASWSHLYRLAINTRPAGAGGAIAVGDAVTG